MAACLLNNSAVILSVQCARGSSKGHVFGTGRIMETFFMRYRLDECLGKLEAYTERQGQENFDLLKSIRMEYGCALRRNIDRPNTR